MSQSDEDPTFFEKERDRISTQITSSFEELLLSTNVLNRKVEEVLGMTREYETIATLWGSFHELMRSHRGDALESNQLSESQGLPGTGGHTLTGKDGTQ